MYDLDILLNQEEVKNEPYFFKTGLDVLAYFESVVWLKLISYNGIVTYQTNFISGDLMLHEDFFETKMLLSTLM